VPDIDGRLTIKPATRADHPALVAALGQPAYFADRLGRARHNGGELLIAWVDGTPVGDVYLWCETLEEPELRAAYPAAPLLNHLEVSPAWQGRGIGAALVQACEEAARRRGYDILLLGVGVDNHEAKRLYTRLGYVDWGHGPIVARWTEPDGRGGIRFAELTVDTMVRSLLAPPVNAWKAWSAAEIASRLSDVRAPWHVVGGCALELWGQTRGLSPIRSHGDVEISVPRGDFPEIATALADLDLYAVGRGAIRPLGHRVSPPSDGWQVWVAERGAYRVDLFLEAGDGETWIFRRDGRITRPYGEAVTRTRDGIPFLRPECALLYKARGRRLPKDELDFTVIAPHLEGDARRWLLGALERVQPEHPWIGALREVRG
jgi:GNAT superfamily N-acetyltransferase